jgi:hypothetical protein
MAKKGGFSCEAGGEKTDPNEIGITCEILARK